MKKNLFVAVALAGGILIAVCSAFDTSAAEELTILYTGETHAMLYPCNCPREPDGGIARRAALVKLLRRKYPVSLLVDAGGFFAGGLQDEYAQNTHLDQARTQIQLRAMEQMGYDAVCVGDDELNFGADFLRSAARESSIDFLSANIGGWAESVKPYTIRKIGGITVGIIGVTPLAAQKKADTLSIETPVEAVRTAQEALRQQGADIVVLLSQLGENADRRLLEDVSGIDILIVGQQRIGDRPFDTVGDTLLLRPTWQGRRLGEAIVEVENKKIVDYQVEEVRLAAQLLDDASVASLLPVCFSDSNCRPFGLGAECTEGGTQQAQCTVPEAHEVTMTVVTSPACVTCHPQFMINEMKKYFPRLSVSVIEYPGEQAQEFIDLITPDALPIYLFTDAVEAEKNFSLIRDNFLRRGQYYVLKTEASGISFFFNRPGIPGRFDLFMRLHDSRNEALLNVVRSFDPAIHFLIHTDAQGLRAPGGVVELEDALRAVCIKEYAPQEFEEYIVCRSAEKESSWWQRCVSSADTAEITACAQGARGSELLAENIALTEELKILTAPTYLLNNQQIFSADIVPQEAELEEIINNANNR